MASKKPNKTIRFITKKLNGVVLRIHRLRLKLKGNARPTSYPIVTGDSFRALAKHIYDETTTFIPGGVSRGDIVFVSQSKALQYLQEIHPNIIVPYILIVHNGDYTFDKRYVSLLDKNIIHCFAQNATVEDSKVTPLPVGLSNFHNFEHTDKPFLTPPSSENFKAYDRKDKFFYRFTNESCMPVRVPLRALCDEHPLMETSQTRVSQSKFVELLRTYKFLISPRGNAIDTHRPYEAFHLGIIPVVQESVTISSLHASGLPFWIVKEWTELENISATDIAKKYEELIKMAKFDAMHMDYWIAKIKYFQEK